jgi:hypothetical protein
MVHGVDGVRRRGTWTPAAAGAGRDVRCTPRGGEMGCAAPSCLACWSARLQWPGARFGLGLLSGRCSCAGPFAGAILHAAVLFL